MAGARRAEVRPRIRLSPDVRRAQIVREATRLIAQRGFNAVSLADVAEACDIRKPSVLHYFPTMSQLLGAVLERRDEQDFEAAGNAVLPAPNPAEARVFYTRVLRRNLEQPELVRLYHVLDAEALSADHPAHSYFAERFSRSREAIEQTLAWAPQPAAAAVELLAFIQGLETTWLRDPSIDAGAVWDGFCDRFFVQA